MRFFFEHRAQGRAAARTADARSRRGDVAPARRSARGARDGRTTRALIAVQSRSRIAPHSLACAPAVPPVMIDGGGRVRYEDREPAIDDAASPPPG
jgi:hypothetical protein